MKTNNLKKQEEKTFFNGGDICDTCGQKMKDIGNGGYTHNCHTPKVATKEERKDFTYSVMPSKVATSEMYCKTCKAQYTGIGDNQCPQCEDTMIPLQSTATSEKDLECKYYNKCPLKVRGEKCTHHDGGNISMNDGATSEKEGIPLHCKHCGKVTSECEEFKKAFDPTPHESEDWVEFNLRARAGIQLQLEQAMKSGRTNKKLDFEEIRKRTDIAFESIKELAQSTSSKAYQRGREEVQTTVGEWIDKNSWKEGAGNEVIQVEDLKKFISGVMKK